MDVDTIEIEVNATGAPLVINLRNPWSRLDSDTVTYYVFRQTPKCDWCDEEMEQQDSDTWNEVWRCPFCEEDHTFMFGMYGEDEITISREEYEVKQSIEHQRDLLRARYGTCFPKSIRDYWTDIPVK